MIDIDPLPLPAPTSAVGAATADPAAFATALDQATLAGRQTADEGLVDVEAGGDSEAGSDGEIATVADLVLGLALAAGAPTEESAVDAGPADESVALETQAADVAEGDATPIADPAPSIDAAVAAVAGPAIALVDATPAAGEPSVPGAPGTDAIAPSIGDATGTGQRGATHGDATPATFVPPAAGATHGDTPTAEPTSTAQPVTDPETDATPVAAAPISDGETELAAPASGGTTPVAADVVSDGADETAVPVMASTPDTPASATADGAAVAPRADTPAAMPAPAAAADATSSVVAAQLASTDGAAVPDPTAPTAPTPAPTVPTPEGEPPPPALQIAEALRDVRRMSDGSHRLSLQLHPEELGAVQLEVAVRDGQLHLRAVAETDSTRRLLAASIPELREQLTDAGVTAGSLEVGAESADDHRRADTEAGDRPAPGSSPTTPTDHASDPASPASDRPIEPGRLDVQL